ncbi:MAG: hypothetical protein VCC36_07490 [Gammaproteobacteria bacterium]
MDIGKIVRIVGVLVAIVTGVATIPEAALIIAVTGLVFGYFIATEDRLAYLVGTIALVTVAGAVNSIPAVGMYLTGILTNLGALMSAGAVTVIAVGIYEKVTA